MNNEIKFQHIKRLWYLEDGVIKTRHGNRLTTATMRQINKRDRLRYRCRH